MCLVRLATLVSTYSRQVQSYCVQSILTAFLIVTLWGKKQSRPKRCLAGGTGQSGLGSTPLMYLIEIRVDRVYGEGAQLVSICKRGLDDEK